jgi:signal transduction histidine kinase
MQTLPSQPPTSPDQRQGAFLPSTGLRLRSGFFSRRLIQESEFTQRAWWQKQFTGYLLAIPLVAAGTIGSVQFEKFPSATMIISVFVIALFWGVGPALFGTALGTFMLDYYLAKPTHELNLTWYSVEQLLPITIACLLVSLITSQRERARRRARTAEEVAKRQAEELVAANKLKDQFLSLASHELKTPIAAIKGYAQLAQRRLRKLSDASPATSAAQESLNKITEQSNRLTALVNDLLDVSRIQAGKLELRLDDCDLSALCQQAVEEQQTTTERTIDLTVPAEPVVLQADCERLGQVLNNLIGNALKYSDRQTRVQVALTCQNGRARVRVQDQGVGIPHDELALVFERFFRARTAREGNQRGLGLGLTICKEIIERHQGCIWAESEEGKGSIFMFELPLAKEMTP